MCVCLCVSIEIQCCSTVKAVPKKNFRRKFDFIISAKRIDVTQFVMQMRFFFHSKQKCVCVCVYIHFRILLSIHKNNVVLCKMDHVYDNGRCTDTNTKYRSHFHRASIKYIPSSLSDILSSRHTYFTRNHTMWKENTFHWRFFFFPTFSVGTFKEEWEKNVKMISISFDNERCMSHAHSSTHTHCNFEGQG